jgi:tight adherence protein C
MSDTIFMAGIGILAGGAVFVLLYAGWRMYNEAPVADRTYMDPLPLKVRLVWPLVRIVAPYAERFMSVEYTEKLRSQLVHSGLFYLYMPYEFTALRIVSAGLTLLAALIIVPLLPIDFFKSHVFWWTVGLGALAYALPYLAMRDRAKRRQKEIVRMLPIYLDFITMTVEAGLSLGGALAQAVAKGPPGLLRNELERVNRDVKAGAGRIEALQMMADRLEIREITTLVNAIALAERTGGSVGHVLRAQADQRLSERFQRAEKLAMEAPVKLIFPLVAFIFPSTFVVLGFPIVMKLLHEMPHR